MPISSEVTTNVLARAISRTAISVLVVTGACGLSGCSSGSAAASGARVVVVERDFNITASAVSVPAGTVTLHIENRGPSTHELNVDETSDASGALPLLANSLQVNEDASALRNVGGLSGIRVDTTRDLTLHLKAGHYVLFCNLEGHYLGGMHLALDVTS